MKFKIGPKELVMGAALLLAGAATKLDAQNDNNGGKFNDKIEDSFNKKKKDETKDGIQNTIDDFEFLWRKPLDYQPKPGEFFIEDPDLIQKFEEYHFNFMTPEKKVDWLKEAILSEEINQKYDATDPTVTEQERQERVKKIREMKELLRQLEEGVNVKVFS